MQKDVVSVQRKNYIPRGPKRPVDKAVNSLNFAINTGQAGLILISVPANVAGTYNGAILDLTLNFAVAGSVQIALLYCRAGLTDPSVLPPTLGNSGTITPDQSVLWSTFTTNNAAGIRAINSGNPIKLVTKRKMNSGDTIKLAWAGSVNGVATLVGNVTTFFLL